MTERRGDQGFAVVTQSVTGGRGRGPNRSHRIAAVIVALAAIALVGIGWLGPRLSARPNFDIAFFATPTPEPTPTPTFPRSLPSPTVTALPVISQPDGIELHGRIGIAGMDALRYLDLATGTTRRVADLQLWRDAVFRTAETDGYGCVCIEDTYQETGSVRILRVLTVRGDEVETRQLAILRPRTDQPTNQPDPQLDVDLLPDHSRGLLASAARSGDEWRIAVRPIDVRRAALGVETRLGRLAVSRPGPSPAPTPTPASGAVDEEVYIDGPHVRLAPDGRSAFVWASAQRYLPESEPIVANGAWSIRLAVDGTVERAVDATGSGLEPQRCVGLAYADPDRLVTLCANDSNGSSAPEWSIRTFDADGAPLRSLVVGNPEQYGYGEPLLDRANGHVFLWDAVNLTIARADVRTGEVASATFEPAAESAPGITTAGQLGPPAWHDGDSAVQQFLFEQLAGSNDGARLYAVGIKPIDRVDSYGQGSLGVFVIDRATLALIGHWAPTASDASVAVLPDGQVVTLAQPGFNAAGEAVSWDGSLTLRDGADGTILARYGRVSIDMPPMVIGP